MDYKKARESLFAGLRVTSDYLEEGAHLSMDPQGKVFKAWIDEDGCYNYDFYCLPQNLPKDAKYEIGLSL